MKAVEYKWLLSIRAAAVIFLVVGPVVQAAWADSAIVVRNVNLRNDSSTHHPPKALLKPPTRLELLQSTAQSGYFHVRLADGTDGWVWSPNVHIVVTTETIAGLADAIDTNWTKPSPVSGNFDSDGERCGPTGDGGDATTNRRKNRTDIPTSYHDVTFQSVSSLQYPVAGKTRDTWEPEQLAEIARVEGVAVRVIGYVVALKPQTGGSGESTNCHWTHASEVDWHIALVEKEGQGEAEAVVVETTPRIRQNHVWTPAKLHDWVDSDQPVRVSGWLMLDPEHRNHLGTYRETLWEIHPITEIEVMQDGQWVALDDIE
jgi:hypothetical protein